MTETLGISHRWDDGGILAVIFDRPGERVNLLTPEILEALNRLLDEVRGRLQTSYARRERSTVFAALIPHLTETLTKPDYDRLANELSLSPSAVKVALHRLRQRFGQTLREVVLETLDDATEIDAEIAELRSVLSSRVGA